MMMIDKLCFRRFIEYQKRVEMKEKIKLHELEIQSFVTEVGFEKLKNLNGGEPTGSKVLICDSNDDSGPCIRRPKTLPIKVCSRNCNLIHAPD